MAAGGERGRTLSRAPIYLSAFVYPGAGQAMQKRWAAAIVYASGFTACFLYFAVCAARILIAFYGLAFRPDSDVASELPKAELLMGGLAALLVYIANAIDAFLAHRRSGLRAARARLEERLRALERKANP